jgi:hypothetical protein
MARLSNRPLVTVLEGTQVTPFPFVCIRITEFQTPNQIHVSRLSKHGLHDSQFTTQWACNF